VAEQKSDKTVSNSKAQQAHWYHPAIKAEAPRTEQATPKIARPSARERMRRRQEDRRLPKPEWTWGIIGLAILGVVGLVALFNLVTAAPAAPDLALPTSVASQLATPGDSVVAAAPVPTVVVKPFDGKSRLTVLIMGLDKRPMERGTTFRADSLILLSLDPSTGDIGMLSIPRDLRVPIPLPNLTEMQPINTAYVHGELSRPGYGPQLTLETVQYNLGIPIQHYVVLSFDTVIKLVDAVGGIDIDVATEIIDEQFPDLNTYGYDPLYIPAGRIHMDGLLALKYARTRHQTNDYDRAARQQQVILALRQRATKPEVLVGLLPQIPAIWESIRQGVITDLSFEELLSIGWFVKDLPETNLKRGLLADKYLLAVNQNGDTLLTINRNNIIELMTNVFGPNYNR
jgi:polyisoprenyl-teichoic acid--peptidoglycan teichoic acid transferase